MLYHFSDDPEIKVFTPRRISKNNDLPPLVWCIDEEHCVNYYFPRQCPRIIYGKSENTSAEDIRKFFADTYAQKIITIPDYMEDEVNKAVIYKYTFSGEGFELKDRIAGYYCSPRDAVPLSVEPVDNLPDLIKAAGAELRFTNDLLALRERILNSTIDNFSMIRLKNLRTGN